MIRKEFDFEQIDLIFRLLYGVLFPKGFDGFQFDKISFNGDVLNLKFKLIELINEEKFCQAEGLLSKELEENKPSRETLQLAVWFYFKLNEFDDEILEKNKFSRHEVLEGLERIEKLVVEV